MKKDGEDVVFFYVQPGNFVIDGLVCTQMTTVGSNKQPQTFSSVTDV